MKKISFVFGVIVVLVFLIWSGQASALGEREKGVLIGIGSSIIYDRVFRNGGGYGYPGPGGYGGYGNQGSFPPFRCSSPNPQSVQCAYERGVYERERQVWQEEKNAAYRCGRYGECNTP